MTDRSRVHILLHSFFTEENLPFQKLLGVRALRKRIKSRGKRLVGLKLAVCGPKKLKSINHSSGLIKDPIRF